MPGLDPLTISDITIPFNLDQVAGVFSQIGCLSAICSCLSKAV